MQYLLLLCSLIVGSFAQQPPQPEDASLNGTSFLNHASYVSSFAESDWFMANIPFIDVPDQSISDVYYYRWSSLKRHLKYTTAGVGYVLTEFVQPVGYAAAFGTIDAAAGHQIRESESSDKTCFG